MSAPRADHHDADAAQQRLHRLGPALRAVVARQHDPEAGLEQAPDIPADQNGNRYVERHAHGRARVLGSEQVAQMDSPRQRQDDRGGKEHAPGHGIVQHAGEAGDRRQRLRPAVRSRRIDRPLHRGQLVGMFVGHEDGASSRRPGCHAPRQTVERENGGPVHRRNRDQDQHRDEDAAERRVADQQQAAHPGDFQPEDADQRQLVPISRKAADPTPDVIEADQAERRHDQPVGQRDQLRQAHAEMRRKDRKGQRPEPDRGPDDAAERPPAPARFPIAQAARS